MARVKRGVTSHAKHKKVLKAAKGYYGRRKNTIRIAKQAVEKAKPVAKKLRETAEGFRDGLQGVERPKPMPGQDVPPRPAHEEPHRPRPRPGPRAPSRKTWPERWPR